MIAIQSGQVFLTGPQLGQYWLLRLCASLSNEREGRSSNSEVLKVFMCEIIIQVCILSYIDLC